MTPITDLITKISRSAFVTHALELLKSLGFPVTDWGDLSPPRSLVEGHGAALEAASVYVSDLAKSAFLRTARGPWLDLHADSCYFETRKPAVTAVKRLLLVNNSGSAQTITAETLKVSPDDGVLVYTNTGGGTLSAPAGSTLELQWRAEAPGSAYNITSTSWELLTPIAGVTVAELPTPALATTGADEEKDEELVSRCQAKWGTIGAGATDGFFKYYCLSASAEVRRVKVAEATPGPSQVTCYLAGSTGGVSGSVVSTVDAVFNTDGRKPQCFTVNIASASVNTISLVGTVYARGAELEAAKNNFEAKLLELQASLDLGVKITRERLIACIMGELSFDPSNDLTLTSPANDVSLASNEVAVFDLSGLSWVSV